MSEQLNQTAQPFQPPNDGAKRSEDPFPPKLSRCNKWTLGISYLFLVLALLYLLDQLCLHITISHICLTYFALGLVFTVLLTVRLVRHKFLVHKARLEDQSEVDATIVEAMNVERRLTKPVEKPDDYPEKKKQLLKEVDRLKNEIGNRGWTEYQVLSLNQLLVDFLKEDELKARTRSSLAELEEYAVDSSYRYDQKHYDQWKDYIDEAIKNIDEAIDKSDEGKDGHLKRDEAGEVLREELRTLIEHVASYRANWAMGSEVIRALTSFGVATIPILLAMGLLPLLHPAGDKVLGIFNWGLLGISGAITAVLLSLRNSNLVEVGNTEGKKELRRAVLGTVLGLVAGILVYSMIAGGILSGTAFPEITPGFTSEQPELKDIALSILWAIASGLSFEWVFDRLRSTTVGES